tara:strand:+ start:1988 stop:2674 length:687 start_codon:yes stop_codon:yes gene_type:complete
MPDEEAEVVLSKPKRKHRWTIMLVGVFLFIFLFLLYTSFFNPNFGQITGNVIKENVVGGVPIQVNLQSPESFEVDGRMDKVDMKVDGSFFVDEKRYDLESASVVIDNFNGEVSFDEKRVVVDGKATKIFIEGIPITGKISVKFDNQYSYLKLGNFYLKNFEYSASGIVRLQDEKVVVNLEDDLFKVKKFYGDLEKRGNTFRLSGFADEASAGLITVKASDTEKISETS